MKTLWGVSFDATPISGVVVEFVKTARIFAERGHRVLLDLGYDIKADKNAFFRPYRREADLLPDWLELARVPGLDQVPGYGPEFVTDVLKTVVGRGEADAALLAAVDSTAELLRDRIVAAWEAHDVTAVLVENGTLPENIAYTRALYLAIEEYGRRRGLGRFVLWRDHDLMWQSEPSTGKYGSYPYPAAPRPVDSPHIHYLVQHDEACERMREWAPELSAIDVLPNIFDHERAMVRPGNADFRRDHAIPEDVPLIARFTRIVPQKRIDRDLHLVAALAGRTDAHLFVAGDTDEAPREYRRLVDLAAELGVTDRVVFGGRLAPARRGSARPPGPATPSGTCWRTPPWSPSSPRTTTRATETRSARRSRPGCRT
ncbi:hypothetical protein [Micromonospora zhanjiangensis]